ncbi:hypothetical protein L0666_16120 [Octadecabacter sp. CECT 8868]|uniref:hypothetical protein n=1 Tax=Octadecabacter algicola TaxID=2909342 RepID=UPI001F34C90F|nr:hypothetical protein [Octadecabacter algicola]MCF2906520.1 hypothetical protein [Octadecabacter algicola]
MRRILLGFGVVATLAGCGDPLRDIARLNDVTVSERSASVAQVPSEAGNTGGGLFGRLLNRQPDDPTNAAVEAALQDAEITPAAGGVGAEDAEVIEVSVAPEPELEQPRRGLGGLFRRSPDRAAPRTGPDASDVDAGTVLPFGQIARVCGIPPRELGGQVDAAAGYRIYDTSPGSTGLRPFYITGFKDDCVRTFTGAVVVTGDVETHEFVRYRPSNERIAYTTTDNAYEALKASECRVGRGQPCGERRTRLDRNTQFITVYNFFGGTFSAVPTQWAQILVHDGEVLAMSIKSGE